MPQIDPGLTCWFSLVQPFHSSLQGGFWNEYGLDLGVIVHWKNTIFFPLDLLLLIIQDNYELSSTHIFILPILKTNSKIFFPNTDWTHPRLSLFGHLLIFTINFYSISPILTVTIELTLILFLSCLSYFSSFIYFLTDKFIVLGVELGGGCSWSCHLATSHQQGVLLCSHLLISAIFI